MVTKKAVSAADACVGYPVTEIQAMRLREGRGSWIVRDAETMASVNDGVVRFAAVTNALERA